MNPTTVYKSAAGIILLAIVTALIACYLSSCSSFDAEAVVNPLTGAAKVSIKATK